MLEEGKEISKIARKNIQDKRFIELKRERFVLINEFPIAS